MVTTVWDLAYGALQGIQGLKFDEEEGKSVAQISGGESLISVGSLYIYIQAIIFPSFFCAQIHRLQRAKVGLLWPPKNM